MNNHKIKYITVAGLISALYIVLSFLSSLFGIASGPIQVRISEALCILPIFTNAAIPGLFIGCALSNLLIGGSVIDIIFGSLATLIGALLTYKLKKHPVLAALSPIASNTLVIPFVLAKTSGVETSIWILFLTIFLGEVISCGLLGFILCKAIKKTNIKFE